MANSGKLLQYFFEISIFGSWAKPISGKCIPYWQILENSSSFFRNFGFPGCDTDGFLENSSSIFSKFQFPGFELDRFLENSSIFGWVCQKLVRVTPRNFSNIIFQLNVLFWMSFPEIGLCHAPKFLNWRLDKFSRNRSSSCPRNLLWVKKSSNFELVVRFSSYCVVESLVFSFWLNLSNFLFVI